MKKLMLTMVLAGLASGAFADVLATNTARIVYFDREIAEKRAAEARARYDAMTAEQKEEFRKKQEERRKAFEEKNKNNPKRIISRVRNEDGSVTIKRADGTEQTYKYVDKKDMPKPNTDASAAQ